MNQLENSVVRLQNDIIFFAKNWAEINLTDLQIENYSTLRYAGAVQGEGRGVMDILFLNVREYASLDSAIVAIIKKHLYICEEWDDSYSNHISAEEWEKYLQNTWIPEYFPKPIFNKYTLDGEISELDFNFQTLGNKDVIQGVYLELLQQISKCFVVHLGDAGLFHNSNCFLAYNPGEHVLYFYDWWLNI